MLINLLEIPIDGKSFKIDHSSGELNKALVDLIGNSAYSTEFSIFPMQAGTFELRGSINTKTQEDCSRCGDDFAYSISEKFHEILMPQLETPRKGHYAKPNHLSDLKENEINAYEFQGHLFDVGAYVHEVIALAQPYNPAPACDKSGKCVLCHKDATTLFHYEDPGFEKNIEKNPFASLKGVKLN